MVDAILDTNQQHEAVERPLDRFKLALKASRQLQADGRSLGNDRVDLYYEDVEGKWLESWQEEK